MGWLRTHFFSITIDTTDLDTEIEAVRLVNHNATLSNMGRLEVNYSGTWGTVCDLFWSYSDAKVACGYVRWNNHHSLDKRISPVYRHMLHHSCRMLGFDDAACAITTNIFGMAETSVPFWMDNVLCLGDEEALDQCEFAGWGNSVNFCSHQYNDAGVVCANSEWISVNKSF